MIETGKKCKLVGPTLKNMGMYPGSNPDFPSTWEKLIGRVGTVTSRNGAMCSFKLNGKFLNVFHFELEEIANDWDE